MTVEHYTNEFREQLQSQLEAVREQLWDLRSQEALLRLSEAAIMETLKETA